MDATARSGITAPRVDERGIRIVPMALFGYPAVLVAHEVGLFAALAEKPQSLADLAEQLRLHPRSVEVMLGVSASIGLLETDGSRWSLTPLAEDYLLRDKSTYWGGYLDYMIANPSLYSFETIRNTLLTNRPQFTKGEPPVSGALWSVHDRHAERAAAFTRWMHSTSIGPALHWPNSIDLSAHRRMLDIGGGSGAHSIGVVLRWPELQARVFDLAPVCDVAREYISGQGLAERIGTVVGDMWKDPFPEADLHFYSLIHHGWSRERCQELTNKSFRSLPSKGRIIVHGILFGDDRTGPFSAAAINVMMAILHNEGREYSGVEIAAMFTEAGFEKVEQIRTVGDWRIVTGVKP